MSRMISVQTGGIFERYGVDEGMRLIAKAGFDCVDLGLNGYLPGKNIHKGIIEGEYTLPEDEFINKVIRPIREAGEKYGVGFGQAHVPYSSWTPLSEEMNDFLMRSFEMCLKACQYLGCPYLVVHPACMHYEQRLDLMIMGTYGEKTFTKKTGLKELSEHDGEIYINPMDYRRLYEKGSFQASVFVDETRNMEGMKDMLERGGYHVLVLRDHIYKYLDEDLLSVIQLPVAVILCIAVFFIAYFVIRLILKSRGVYFATVRMLGMGKKPARRIMRVELMIDCAIAFALFMIFVFLSKSGVLMLPALADHINYLTAADYIILAAILLVMAVLISGRFMRTIFKSSAMGTYREEA